MDITDYIPRDVLIPEVLLTCSMCGLKAPESRGEALQRSSVEINGTHKICSLSVFLYPIYTNILLH